MVFNSVAGIIENIEADPDSGAGKLKIMYDSCIDLGKYQ